MKTIVQIIGKDQCDFIKEMYQGTQGFERLWVLDRCKDNSSEMLTSLKEFFLENKEGTGFLAGKTRDIGLNWILDRDYDVVVMFDGDRVPFNLTNDLIEKEMNLYDCTFALAEDDFRVKNNFKKYYKSATAGMIVKTSFLKKVRKLSFMSNRCFHPRFDSKYGSEDTFLGACLYSLGAKLEYSDLRIKGKIPSGAKYPSRISDENAFNELIKKLGVFV